MSLYSQNLRKPSRSRIPLFKQLDDTEPGFYCVSRIFFPGKYPSASLCTPFFRVSIPQKDWEEIQSSITSERGIIIYFDGDTWELLKDEWDLFAARYEGDQWGAHFQYDDPDHLFLSPTEWQEGQKAMRAANEPANKSDSEQKNLPF